MTKYIQPTPLLVEICNYCKINVQQSNPKYHIREEGNILNPSLFTSIIIFQLNKVCSPAHAREKKAIILCRIQTSCALLD